MAESVAKKNEFVRPFLNLTSKVAWSSPCSPSLPPHTILGVKGAVEPLTPNFTVEVKDNKLTGTNYSKSLQ